MKLKVLIFFLFTLTLPIIGQISIIKITINPQDVEINRYYYFDDFSNMIFLEEENEILTIYNHLQIIDGKNDISYILNPGDDINIPFVNDGFAYLISRNNDLRTRELRYSVDHYQKFKTTILNEASIPKFYIDSAFIEQVDLRDSLIWNEFNQEINFLKQYKEQEGLSNEFYQTQYDFLKSIFMERYLAAFYVPFSNEYLQFIQNKAFSFLNNPKLLYISSFKEALINYSRINNKLSADEVSFDKSFHEEIQAFVLASDIASAIADSDFSVIKQEEKETYIHNFLQDCKVPRFCNYIQHKTLKFKLSGQQLLDLNLNHINFEDVIKEGKTYLIFWASWCGPCIKSIKESGTTRNELIDNKINIVFISIDKVVQDWQRAIEKLEIEKYPHYNMNENSELSSQLGIEAVPNYKLVKEGQIIMNNMSSLSDPSTKDKILSIK